ncbi:MAG: GHKL domain-containing protein, partial [Oscillatoriales cyanobacterium]
FEAIFSQLYQSINQLMDATIFGIGIYHENKQEIHYELAMEKGVPYLPYTRSMQDKSQLPVQCILEKKAIMIHDLVNENGRTSLAVAETLEDGTKAEEPQSLIYLPLLNNQETVLGIITVQSFQRNAYTDYHLNILRNLAIYTGIALENAESFAQIQLQNAEINTQREEILTTLENLQTAQEQLIQAEKLAVMGKLVASVAHEINTPLGAIRASAGNIVTDLNEALQELPKLFQILTAEQQENFFALVRKALETKALLSSREERAARKVLEKELTSHEIAEADALAYELTNMGIYENINPFLLIFRDKNALFVTKIAYHLVNQQRSTDNIQVAVDRASKVVFALKTYARHDQSGEKMKANVTSGIETVLTLYHNQLKQNTEVVRNYSEVPEILCYPDELNQVWTNLIHNAMQAMTSKGTLKIGIKEVENSIEVSIKDNGSGIPDDIKPKIFDAFFTTKPEGEGSGLGLDIVKKIIDKHDGKIGFESEVGKGTTFWVRLPMGV